MDHSVPGEHDATDRSMQHSAVQVSGTRLFFELPSLGLSNAMKDLQCVANCDDPDKLRRFSQPVIQT